MTDDFLLLLPPLIKCLAIAVILPNIYSLRNINKKRFYLVLYVHLGCNMRVCREKGNTIKSDSEVVFDYWAYVFNIQYNYILIVLLTHRKLGMTTNKHFKHTCSNTSDKIGCWFSLDGRRSRQIRSY